MSFFRKTAENLRVAMATRELLWFLERASAQERADVLARAAVRLLELSNDNPGAAEIVDDPTLFPRSQVVAVYEYVEHWRNRSRLLFGQMRKQQKYDWGNDLPAAVRSLAEVTFMSYSVWLATLGFALRPDGAEVAAKCWRFLLGAHAAVPAAVDRMCDLDAMVGNGETSPSERSTLLSIAMSRPLCVARLLEESGSGPTRADHQRAALRQDVAPCHATKGDGAGEEPSPAVSPGEAVSGGVPAMYFLVTVVVLVTLGTIGESLMRLASGSTALPVVQDAPDRGRGVSPSSSITPAPEHSAAGLPQSLIGTVTPRLEAVRGLLSASAPPDEYEVVRQSQLLQSFAPVLGQRQPTAAAELNRHGLKRMTRPAEAAESFLEAVRLDPGNVEALNNLGYAWFLAGRLQDAETALLSALALESTRSEAWVNLGELYATRGDARLASAAFLNAYRFSPNQAVTIRHLAARQSGNQKGMSEAARVALLAIQLHPLKPASELRQPTRESLDVYETRSWELVKQFEGHRLFVSHVADAVPGADREAIYLLAHVDGARLYSTHTINCDDLSYRITRMDWFNPAGVGEGTTDALRGPFPAHVDIDQGRIVRQLCGGARG